MSDSPLTEHPPLTRQAVRIATSPGTIRITAPSLFGGADGADVHRMVQCLLDVDAVETVDIDHAAAEVVVGYDRSQLTHARALSDISVAIKRERPAACERASEIDLAQVIGKVVRVERRQRRGGMFTTIYSAGADLLAAVSRPIAGRGATDASVNGDGAHLSRRRDRVSVRYLSRTSEEALVPRQQGVVVVHGWRRAASLAAAGGCFFMSFVGLVTPGIPTVPFVLATSYFLVRSSPALDERLRRSRLFGQMVRDWSAYHGMRAGTKRNVVILTLAIMGGTLLVFEPSLPILVVAGFMGTLGVSMILLTRTVPDDAPDIGTQLLLA